MRRALLAVLILIGSFAAPAAIAAEDLGAAYERVRPLLNAQRYAEALPEMRRLADAGEPRAQYGLGIMYSQGWGLAQSKETARVWFERAANQGNGDAAYNLGIFYDTGTGAPVDRAQALAWFRRAGELGHAQAAYNAGHLYIRGDGVPVSLNDAFYWFNRSAELGEPAGQNAIGYAYRNGFGTAMDWDMARYWYRRAIEGGSEAAEHNMREIIRMSLVSARSWEEETGEPERARPIYQDGCYVDLVPACIDYGRMLYYGLGGSVDMNGAAQSYLVGCNAGFEEGCRGHAYAILKVPQRRSEISTAAAYFQRACDRMENTECYALAYMKNETQFGMYDREGTKRILTDLCFNRNYQTACDPLLNIMNAENAAYSSSVSTSSSGGSGFGSFLGDVALGLLGGIAAMGQAASAYQAGGSYADYSYNNSYSSSYSSSSYSANAIQDAADWNQAMNAIQSINTMYVGSCRVGNAYC